MAFHNNSLRGLYCCLALGIGFMVVQAARGAADAKKATPEQEVEAAIQEHNVVVFSKTYCPYCRRAKELLEGAKAGAHVVELDVHPLGRQLQNYLLEKTGQRTVPNVFIGGKHIGGSDKVGNLHSSGELAQLIEQGRK
eukprot:TRINITY_DN2464_c0_g1_i1.p1 TRINITY_DN2464_c0_g1~~TRINITY_DN2464_c0_g1_i1.p1  ORF type:complete len:138 (-),score=39.94 TRINITY_DN2464_c0_g1_i1:25-438(-)